MKTRRQFFGAIGAALVGGAAAAVIPKPAATIGHGLAGVNYHDALKAGVMSVNEVRALENLNPLPGGGLEARQFRVEEIARIFGVPLQIRERYLREWCV